MGRMDYRTLINCGRKAGLRTGELYSAMTGRAPEGKEQPTGEADSNGFLFGLDQKGQRVYRPIGPENTGR